MSAAASIRHDGTMSAEGSGDFILRAHRKFCYLQGAEIGVNLGFKSYNVLGWQLNVTGIANTEVNLGLKNTLTLGKERNFATGEEKARLETLNADLKNTTVIAEMDSAIAANQTVALKEVKTVADQTTALGISLEQQGQSMKHSISRIDKVEESISNTLSKVEKIGSRVSSTEVELTQGKSQLKKVDSKLETLSTKLENTKTTIFAGKVQLVDCNVTVYA
ncbi:hypothetical protein [Dongshaea marina]|uniref:hypothetical protein n=1 Tax=Dongshaea marina TaxID=2047966 RepID=UPI000D3E92B1|nr:hypothetical protein [Dongshaea marina]